MVRLTYALNPILSCDIPIHFVPQEGVTYFVNTDTACYPYLTENLVGSGKVVNTLPVSLKEFASVKVCPQ